ncbi:MAG: hypothetical protein IPP46_20420 [Bacteroidetes bacterium]|nr:hypothetical protein [Bacteroidota bacterium]
MVNYGTPGGYESANFIKECSDKGFIVTGYNGGTFPSNATSDIWVLKTDSLGVLIWDQTFSGSLSEEGKSVDICLDGGYIVSGQTNSSTGIGAGNHGGYDEIVLKLDATGNLTWVKVFGGSNSDFGNSVISLPDGGFILGGSTESTNGDLDDDGLHYGSYWLKKLDALGNIEWSKRYGSGSCRLNSLVRSPDGHLVMAGNVVTNPPVPSIAEAYGTFHFEDFWIIKTDAAGNIIWKKVIGGNNRDYCQSVTCTNDGWIAVAGFTNSNDGYFSNLVGNYDNWVFKLKNVAHISAFANNFEICGANPLLLTASPGKQLSLEFRGYYAANFSNNCWYIFCNSG